MISIDDIAGRQTEILRSLAARWMDLDRYSFTVSGLRRIDVSSDPRFQKTFNGLYMVRRGEAWRMAYFGIMEAHKNDLEVRFETVLQKIFEKTGRVEASFASKLIATINPNNCIYDSVIRMNLGIPSRAGPFFPSRSAALGDDYRVISAFFEACLATDRFLGLRLAFDQTFPDFQHFSDIKVLDFMIWQMRAPEPARNVD